MTLSKKAISGSILLIAMMSNVHAAGMADMASGMATDSLKEQAVDKSVDMGSDMAKKQFTAGSNLPAEGISATSGGLQGAATDAIAGSAKDQATEMAIDQGADMAKGTAKSLIK